MTTVVAEEELYRSCRLIFGKNLKVSREFFEYLQLSGIKKAYRQRALELHPDINCSQGQMLRQGKTAQFIDVHKAYENLIAYLNERDKGICLPSDSSQNQPRQKKSSTVTRPHRPDHSRATEFNKTPRQDSHAAKSHFLKAKNGRNKQPSFHIPVDPETLYKGSIPKCPLLFGRYLYYSGIINLQIIGQALVWQRSQRPLLGEIGCRFGWLSKKDAFQILKLRKENQLFGESALALGLLTIEQLQHMILQQKKLHKRFGQYFVARNYWNSATLAEFIMMQKDHNNRMRHFSA
jgi:hypothetical protein